MNNEQVKQRIAPDFAFYEENAEGLLKPYENQFIVISEQAFMGAYSTQWKAMQGCEEIMRRAGHPVIAIIVPPKGQKCVSDYELQSKVNGIPEWETIYKH